MPGTRIGELLNEHSIRCWSRTHRESDRLRNREGQTNLPDGFVKNRPRQPILEPKLKQNLLVIVHPGSACGSADFYLGSVRLGTSGNICRMTSIIG